MCTMCAALRPSDPLAITDQHLTGTHLSPFGTSGSLADGTMATGTSALQDRVFTLDQIAFQLTDGFAAWVDEEPAHFALDASRTLTINLAGLENAAVRAVTLMALEAWTDVTGIRFVSHLAPPAVTAVRTEVGNVVAGTASTARMAVGEAFDGTLSTSADRDWVRVRLTAGETYVIREDARGGSDVDAFLRMRNAQGTLLAQNDDTNGSGSQITFRATTTGDYFVDAGSLDAETSGAYRLQVYRRAAADITFDDEEEGAFATSESANGIIQSSFVNLEPGWSDDPISMNSDWFQTMLHEIGHALGLGHAGNYNGDAVWGRDNLYANDSYQATVMSYFSQGDGGFGVGSVNPNIGASYAYLATAMPADIIAMQTMYGTNFATRAGNTTYGANSNVTGHLGTFMDQAFGDAAATQRYYINLPVALTIFDTGGIDTLDFSTFDDDQLVNLTAGTFSNVAGLIENLQIARGVFIENAIGGAGDDRLVGNARANVLTGNIGGDPLIGGIGNDTLNGSAGFDRLEGGAGSDSLTGGSSGDAFVYVGGADRIADFANNSDTIILERDLWGGGNRSVANVLASFASDTGSDVLFTFAAGATLRVTGLATVTALLDDITFI